MTDYYKIHAQLLAFIKSNFINVREVIKLLSKLTRIYDGRIKFCVDFENKTLLHHLFKNKYLTVKISAAFFGMLLPCDIKLMLATYDIHGKTPMWYLEHNTIDKKIRNALQLYIVNKF